MTKTTQSSFYGTVFLTLGLLLFSGQIFGQLDITRSLFTPVVVPETQTDPVRFEATVTGSPPAVVFVYDGADRPMFNDGTHGDQVAGDDTWTIMFTASEILSKNTPSRVFRPFIGFVRIDGFGSLNVFGEVWTSEIGSREVRSINGGGQETDYIANYAATRAELMTFDPRVWAQRFYQTHGDDFDFLNFVLIPGRRGNRFHSNVKNTIQGIGLSIFDTTATFGSAGKLKGYSQFPISSFFDGGEKAFSHETGHQWINFLANTPFASGRPHWPRGNIAGNMMGFSISGGVGGDYPFTFTPNGSGGYVVGSSDALFRSTFNSMELYLMGLVPPEQVGDFFILTDQNQNITAGQTLQSSEVTPVTLAQIVAVHGARIPDSTQSQKNFRVATIAISEELLDAHAMAFYDYFARRTEARNQLPFASGFTTGTCNPWYLATGGRSVMRSALNAMPTPFDFDGDHRTDISVFRPSDGNWYVLNSGNDPSFSITNWGNSTDIQTPADFDNDGKADIAVFRPSTGEWFVVNSSDFSFTVTNWGAAGDIPLAADFDGDGKADISVFRPSNGTWYIFRSDGTGWDIVQWGAVDDIPVPGSYDSDNKSDIAVYRPSTGQWFVLPSMGSGYAVSWGTLGDIPVAADYDGDAKDDIAIYRPSDGNWYILKSSTNNSQADVISWGAATDIPVPGDYDGDGRADVAQFRPSTGDWFVLRSTSGYDVVNWGIGTDKPIPAAYIP